MNIILPTLRSERRKLTVHFCLCSDTGKVLGNPVIEMDKKNNSYF